MSNKKNKLAKIIMVLSLALMTSVSPVDAHSGRTDSSGGHRDNKNKSGLGSYHYHHGYGPHLHTNGCPYSSTTTNSDGGRSSSSVDHEAQQKKAQEQEQEEVKSKGYNSGYNDGYIGKTSGSYYSGSYSELYQSRYDEGYTQGREKLEKEKEELNTKGYELGLTGSKINLSNYTNEELKAAYNYGYEKGIIEYKNIKTEKYRTLGLEDGKADKQNLDIPKEDEEFSLEYEKSYKSGQDILSKTYEDKGYNDAFTNSQYKSPGYQRDKYNQWHKQGFDKAIEDIKRVKKLGYDDGYSRNEKNVPNGLERAESMYLQEYKKGEAVADKEARDGAVGFSSVASIGWILRRYFVAKKSIM